MLAILSMPMKANAAPWWMMVHHFHHGMMIGNGMGGSSAALLPAEIAFSIIAAACIWHIPAWEQAKANHTEAAYQSQKMWPQVQVANFGNSLNAKVSSFENSL